MARQSCACARLGLTVLAVLCAGMLVWFAAPARANVSTLSTRWLVQSSANTTASTPSGISTPGFDTSGWVPETTDDAGGGLTEIGALAQNGLQAPGAPNPQCSFRPHAPGDPNSLQELVFSDNMRQCWGQEEGENRGLPTNPEFAVPWWFRSDFQTPHGFGPGDHAQLIVNGIVGQADVWVNGTEVATQDTVAGDYTQFRFDISGLLRRAGKTNTIAFEVYPNQPATMFTLDNVDWTQIAPDHNSGIQFPVQIDYYGGVALSNAHVVENNAADMSSSALTVKGDVTNPTGEPQTATVSAVVKNPQGGTVARLTQLVAVAANSTQTVVFDPTNNPSLAIHHPQLWWPWQMGGQPLYSLQMNVAHGASISDTASETFGIRTVTSSLTTPTAQWPDGVRQFAVNGKPFVWRSGGWGENEYLRYSSKDAANQIQLMKSLGLQGIRTEGKEMPDNFYEQMDKAGMIIDGGFQCCDDSWQPASDGSNLTPRDFNIMFLSALTIGEQLRNHPSVFNFSWSDNAPIPEQEIVSLQGFSQADFQDPLISSADENSSPILGPSGEKEGPYDYGAPSYWYSDTSGNDGGFSTGFDSEASPGDTVPTLDSLNRFLSASDQATLGAPTTTLPNGQLTPDTCYFGTNEYHMNWETACPTTGFNFGTMNNFDIAVYNRYGPWLPSKGTPTATGDLTAGSPLITDPSSTSGSPFQIDEPVTGAGIPAGTTLQDTSTTGTATITNGSDLLTKVVVESGEFAVGSTVTAARGIPAGTTITAINGNTFTMSAKATRNSSGATITGSPVWTLSQSANANGTGVALTGKAPTPLSGGAHVAPGLNQFVEEAQPTMYEADRAQFEAYIDHSTNFPNPSTGTDFWLLNHAFPTLLWGLYNTDYDTNGGFFGAKKANETLHALYVYDNSANSDNNSVTLDNLSGTTQSGLSIESKVYDFSGKVLDDQTASGITLPSQGVMNTVLRPNVPAATTPPTPAQTYFVELVMRQNGHVVDRNVYWVSTQQDLNTTGSASTPTFNTADSYGDLTELQKLPATTLKVTAASHHQSGLADGQNAVDDVTVTNTGSTVAFFVRVDLRRGSRDGRELPGDNEVLPVSDSDNDITLWPGESQTIQISYDSSKLEGASPVDSVFGWNVPYFDVAARDTQNAPDEAQAAADRHGITSFGLADGVPRDHGAIVPGQDNTRAEMRELRKLFSVQTVNADRREAAR